eukprot:NODE_16169_length_1008_cov_10.942111.p1 GENE.NODE_16169_length_1008_cov_10.942111~~NODE_16169_length_1008_cov_10.942111.p1  ORF type:complete len:271 (+),score=31.79 NODE_16169_length_1008_cov_10.942111:98-814(+)
MARKCRLPSGPVDSSLLLLLLMAALLTVAVKKKREDARNAMRSWGTFALDFSKQGFGMSMLHCINRTFATRCESNADECAWYWLQVVIDTTVGVGIEYLLLRGAARLLWRLLGDRAADFDSGDYRNDSGNFAVRKYLKQLLLWLVIVVLMKTLMLCLMYAFSGFFLRLSGIVLCPLRVSSSIEIAVVMVITPLIMNAVQFWLSDNFLKYTDNTEQVRRVLLSLTGGDNTQLPSGGPPG